MIGSGKTCERSAVPKDTNILCVNQNFIDSVKAYKKTELKRFLRSSTADMDCVEEYFELVKFAQDLKDTSLEQQCLHKLLEISPTFSMAKAALISFYERSGQWDLLLEHASLLELEMQVHTLRTETLSMLLDCHGGARTQLAAQIATVRGSTGL